MMLTIECIAELLKILLERFQSLELDLLKLHLLKIQRFGYLLQLLQ